MKALTITDFIGLSFLFPLVLVWLADLHVRIGGRPSRSAIFVVFPSIVFSITLLAVHVFFYRS